MTVAVQVIPADQWQAGEGTVGYFDPAAMTIAIRGDLSPAMQESTFWHEVIHCFEFVRGGDRYTDEQFCDQLGGLMHQMRKSWVK
jgi:hypothetical protein